MFQITPHVHHYQVNGSPGKPAISIYGWVWTKRCWSAHVSGWALLVMRDFNYIWNIRVNKRCWTSADIIYCRVGMKKEGIIYMQTKTSNTVLYPLCIFELTLIDIRRNRSWNIIPRLEIIVPTSDTPLLGWEETFCFLEVWTPVQGFTKLWHSRHYCVTTTSGHLTLNTDTSNTLLTNTFPRTINKNTGNDNYDQ